MFKSLLATLVVVCVSLGASADVIEGLYNIDFARNRGGVVWNASTDDTTNYLLETTTPGSNMTWNVHTMPEANYSPGSSFMLEDLSTSTGQASTLSFAVDGISSDGYSDETLRDGVWTSYLTKNNGLDGSQDAATVTISGLSQDQSVNLVLYTGHARWGGAEDGSFTFDDTTKTFRQEGQTSSMPLVEGETYIRFDGLLPDVDGNIIGSYGQIDGGDGAAAWAGAQIQVIPEPASIGLLGLFGIVLILRHKLNKQ